MTLNALEIRGRQLLRQQALWSGLMSLFSALIYFAVDFPFPRVIASIALVAAAAYFSYYLFFDLICRTCYGRAGAALSVVGVVTLTLVVNYTGGIVSPFIFLYFCIIISEALYGLENSVTLPAALAGYFLVVAGQFWGFIPYSNSWASEIYRSPLAAFLITMVTGAYLLLAGRITKLIVTNLRLKLETGAAEKEALLQKFSELNATAQIGVLAHRIAHDLRGPISSVSGYIQIEQLKPKTPEELETLADLSSVVQNMEESLRGITRFGRTGAGSREKILLADFMDSLLAIIAYSPQASGVQFTRLFPERNHAAVAASRADLQQAYFNIIKNSVEAVRDNPGSKVVEIAIKTEGNEALVSVSDNGPGIPPEILGGLFSRSITTKKEGTGVGLIITKALLEQNSGGIELFNRGGGGFSVLTRLPLA